jgi:hypothetical protein
MLDSQLWDLGLAAIRESADRNMNGAEDLQPIIKPNQDGKGEKKE